MKAHKFQPDSIIVKKKKKKKKLESKILDRHYLT